MQHIKQYGDRGVLLVSDVPMNRKSINNTEKIRNAIYTTHS